MNLETYKQLNHGNMVKSGTLIGHVVGKIDGMILIREKNNRTSKIYSVDYQSVTIWGPQIGGPSGYPGQPEDPVLVAPKNMALPTLSGDPSVGSTLTCNIGTWIGEPTPSFSRQWLRNGTSISGATGATYELVEDDGGKNISVRVTATNSQGTAQATSAATPPVEVPVGA